MRAAKESKIKRWKMLENTKLNIKIPFDTCKQEWAGLKGLVADKGVSSKRKRERKEKEKEREPG